jgi:hypothetical protein
LADDIVRAAGGQTHSRAPTFEDDGRLLCKIEKGADVLAEMTYDVLSPATDVRVRFNVVVLNAGENTHSIVVAKPSDFGLKPEDFEYGDVYRMFEEVEDQPIEITPALCASWF